MSGEKYFSQIQMMVPPTRETHVVNLKYLIGFVSGKIKNPVRVVAAGNLDGNYDYATMSITSTYAELLPDQDGVTLNIGDRILVAGQTNRAHNGIYVFTAQGDNIDTPWVLVRAADFSESYQLANQIKIPIAEGNVYGGTFWSPIIETTSIIIGETELEFIQIDDSASSPQTMLSRVLTITGDGINTEFTLYHGLNTKNITHTIYDMEGTTVYMDVTRTTENTIAINTGLPIEQGITYTILVIAASE